MKKILLLSLFLSQIAVNAQLNLKTIKDKVEKTTNNNTANSLSNDEVVKGLKEALEVGVKNAGDSASRLNGFNKNELIRIPFPEEAQKMETTLRKIGMDKEVDEFELVLNRAAESASKKAAPIFITAIKNMKLSDGMSILKGDKNAATEYLEKSTSDSLYQTFLPIVQQALKEVNVTKYWNPLASAYNKIPLTTKVNPDLEDYTTSKAMDGLFALLAIEEQKIRENPTARVTDLLKKVFE